MGSQGRRRWRGKWSNPGLGGQSTYRRPKACLIVQRSVKAIWIVAGGTIPAHDTAPSRRSGSMDESTMLRRDGALDSQDKSGFVVAPVTSAGRRPASEIYERAGLVESTTRRNAEEPNSRECRVPSVERPPAPPHCSRGWRSNRPRGACLEARTRSQRKLRKDLRNAAATSSLRLTNAVLRGMRKAHYRRLVYFTLSRRIWWHGHARAYSSPENQPSLRSGARRPYPPLRRAAREVQLPPAPRYRSQYPRTRSLYRPFCSVEALTHVAMAQASLMSRRRRRPRPSTRRTSRRTRRDPAAPPRCTRRTWRRRAASRALLRRRGVRRPRKSFEPAPHFVSIRSLRVRPNVAAPRGPEAQGGVGCARRRS